MNRTAPGRAVFALMVAPVLLAVLLGVFLAAAPPAAAERMWLLVGASDRSPAAIAAKARPLERHLPGGLVVQTADCGDTPNVFAWVSGLATSPEAARADLPRLKGVVKDGYVKSCEVRPGSLLALRVPAVDASIADVPADAVNWADADRVSEVRPLPDGRALVIARWYADRPDDPLEGRRERVILVDTSDRKRVLTDDCPRAGPAAVREGRIAFACAREQAADHLLHGVLAFDAAGTRLAEIPRCRDPKWLDSGGLGCETEAVGPDGELELHALRLDLTGAVHPAGGGRTAP